MLGKLYDLVAPELLTLALHLTQRPAQAEDLVQEVFLQAIQDRDQWDAETSVEVWMTHLLAAHFERALEASDKNAYLTSLDDSNARELPGDPVLEAQRSELSETLAAALAELPDVYRTVVRLLIQDGMNSEQAAEALERPAGTVRSQLARGLDRLRRILPATLGLGVWLAADKRPGTKTTAQETLDGLKQRFFEDHPSVAKPLRPPTLTSSWIWTAGAVGVGLLSLAAVFWNSDSAKDSGAADSFQAAAGHIVSAQEIGRPSLRSPATFGQRKSVGPEVRLPQSSPIRVSGHVLGKFGEAIPGATVSLYYWEPWSDQVGDHELETITGYGWSTTTDAAGHYELDLPCLPPGNPALHVGLGENHTEELLRFASGSSHLQPIRMGHNEMPAVQLFPAGAVKGLLLQHDGSPAYPAHIEVYPGKDPSMNQWYSTKPDGSFDLPGLPAGLHNLRLSRRGLIQQTTVMVQAGSTVDTGTTLFPEPIAIQVHVTNEQGQDLCDARIRFAPTGQSQEAYYFPKKTDKNGRVDVLLPSFDQHSIDVIVKEFESEQDTYYIAAGQKSLEVRMQPTSMTRVRATDESTGLPLSRFNLLVETLEGTHWAQTGKINYVNPDAMGIKSIEYTPDARCRVYRMGYQAAYFDFRGDLPDVVEVQLHVTHPVSGRILLAGTPSAGLSVEICIRNSPGLIDPSGPKLRLRIQEEAEEVLWAETDIEGVFTFEPLADAGMWYCLRVHDRLHNGVEHWFQVDKGNPAGQNLGDLELQPTGILRGKVQVPDGINPMGMTFMVDFATGALTAVADSAGAFELKNIAEGEHILRLQKRAGFASLEREFTFTIQANQTLEQAIDLRPLARCLRHLQISDKGQPLANHKVYLSVDKPVDPASWEACFMGFTDINGHVTGELPMSGMTSVWTQSQAGEAPRRHPTANVPLTSKVLPIIEVAY